MNESFIIAFPVRGGLISLGDQEFIDAEKFIDLVGQEHVLYVTRKGEEVERIELEVSVVTFIRQMLLGKR